MTPGDKLQKNIEKIEKKCLSCRYGSKEARGVACGHIDHPGYVGGIGSEWVFYCDHYSKKKPDTKRADQ